MNFSPWVILFSPFTAVLITVLLTPNFRKLSSYISVAAVGISFIFSLAVFFGPDGSEGFNWIDLGVFKVQIGYLVNDLTKLMLLVVSGVGLLIHIYSIGYMGEDRGRSRYFSGLSLFMFSMLGIVLANNFIMMFIFWELVGVSSYILIGHWFDRDAPPAAGNKAFLANRIGDFGFIFGILLVWSASGTVTFEELARRWPSLGLSPGFMTAAALLIFCGAVGKSAQFPLHVWLPDAMEGPTPVSALIHAATMVTAGVYLVARCMPLFGLEPVALLVVAAIGGFTALLTAAIAVTQTDLKRVLAYSTISQLGYMFLALGCGVPSHRLAAFAVAAAIFHLFTHAFFKALLFLSAGSVMHAMGDVIDMRRFSGLRMVL